MTEELKPYAKEALAKVNKTLETLGIEHLKIVQVEGIRFGLAGDVSESVLANLAKLFWSKPRGGNNCYEVADFVKDNIGSLDAIQTKESSKLIGGNHCINFGQGLLVDLSSAVNSSLGGMLDALVIPLPNNYDTHTDSYLALANLVYGGQWEYRGQGKHDKFRAMKAAFNKIMGF